MKPAKVLFIKRVIRRAQSQSVQNSGKGLHHWRSSDIIRVMNALQTKHFQTLFWTPDVRLVDCPGLVMPNFVPMEMQVPLPLYIIFPTHSK
jgi:hypothetical protein